ncbi:YjgP/YjgQ family permease [Mucilaginibacter limnophilus]|uniref:YjgP/YjgQ family permease n=1 Tax=Mucilaginibacter limnophilus TaxID=1932778 RepID=A0A3S3TE60_9SPHI|nr:LptF/LptG family permease [Mucilaginibacter limnophilus]RVT96488.1 YjgP/YjgQ family permease [Mucilaginibacter limnophilus]
MKKIHLLLLKAFIRPFIVTFLIVMFVLLMLFLFKYIDDLIGKGFEWYVIAELMMYASATNVAMALPLSVLLSSIMTYGSLGENYELVAIKSAGISLRRAMYPMFIVVAILAVSAFVFSDYMLPVANLKYYSLLYDARKQKSAKLLQEGVFSSSFPGYSIRVLKKGDDGQTLKDIMIYSKAPKTGNMDVTLAKEGTMFRTPGDKFLVVKLRNGVRYAEDAGDNGYNRRQRLIRFRFKETEVKLDLSEFKFKRTNEEDFRSAFVMMNIKQLRNYQDSTKRIIDSSESRNFSTLMPYIKFYAIPKKSDSVKNYIRYNKKNILAGMKTTEQISAVSAAQSEIRSIQDMMKSRNEGFKETGKNIRRSVVEYQKKFTLSVACLVLFLIGAPLGAIIRKGGLGLPVVVSVIFFLLYHIISTIGEKGVKDGAWNPIVGMWIAIFVLTPIGMFLSYKAATDSALFDLESYKRFFNKLLRRKAAV